MHAEAADIPHPENGYRHFQPEGVFLLQIDKAVTG